MELLTILHSAKAVEAEMAATESAAIGLLQFQLQTRLVDYII
jgi:hypothetical protein